MMLFSFSDYEPIAQGLLTTGLFEERRFTVARYANQELHATVQDSPSGEHCYLLGSIAPPDPQIISLMLLAHTLKQEGAARVTGILPYLAYSRQDKIKGGESLSTAWVGSLLKASGLDEVLTVDAHSERDRALFPVPLISLSPAKLFSAAIHKHGLLDATIVAVDNGAIPRCEAVKAAVGLPSTGTPHFRKKRTEAGVEHSGLIGEVSRRVIFVDDMLDTGRTLVSACERLVAAKVEEIYIFVTAGLFTGTEWEQLWSLGVKHIFCTDTVRPFAPGIEGRKDITVLPVAPLLCDHFRLDL